MLPYSTNSILTNLSFGVNVQIHVGAASKFCMQPPSKSRPKRGFLRNFRCVDPNPCKIGDGFARCFAE